MRWQAIPRCQKPCNRKASEMHKSCVRLIHARVGAVAACKEIEVIPDEGHCSLQVCSSYINSLSFITHLILTIVVSSVQPLH